MADPLRIEKKLRADHAVSSFDCGQEELNRFLSRFALVNLRAGAAHFGFIPSPTDALHLYLLVKDIKRLAYH